MISRLIVTAFLLCFAVRAAAFSAFEISDVRIDGLVHISDGTVYSYLPLEVGDQATPSSVANAIKSLYRTGLFKDIEVLRDGDVLVVNVEERATIADIQIDGNEAVEDEDLMTALSQVGIAQTKPYDPSSLEYIQQALERQYYNLGKYGVIVDVDVEELPRNRARVKVDIQEGVSAKIRDINVVGNQVFSDEELLDNFNSSTPSMFSFFTSSDQYSSPKLAADIENMKSFYLDRGYVDFSLDSSAVSISPDRKSIYVTVNLSEGEQYTVSKIDYAGNLIVPLDELQALAEPLVGQLFSRKEVTKLSDVIREKLGERGYAFARINPVPEKDDENKTIGFTIVIEPNNRVYVRRINILGNKGTDDHVIRRELRQYEGAWLSTSKIERSRTRIERLGFFDSVAIDIEPVPNTEDQVDVVVEVNERPSGTMLASLGYQQSVGVTVDFSVTKENFMGTGKRVGVTFRNSKVSRIYEFSYTNPYYTIDGVSRGFNLFNRETNNDEISGSNYTTNDLGGELFYRIPLSEFNSMKIGLEAAKTELLFNDLGVPCEIYSVEDDDFTRPNIDGAPGGEETRVINKSCGDTVGFTNKYGQDFKTLSLDLSWAHDTRNRRIFPDDGVLHQVNAEVALPIGDLSFYKLTYKQERHYPLPKNMSLKFEMSGSYGDGYGDLDELPFFEHYFAGGTRSVRGYESNSLGPKVAEGRFGTNATDYFGGPLKTLLNAELLFPPPFAPEEKNLRMSLFLDGGMVYDALENFESSELRYSSGMAMMFVSPIGAMSFSYAWPLNDEPGDELEAFQFTLGTSF